MKKIVLLAFFTHLSIIAQIKFETGYFINNTNIKTNCLIRNLDWYKNPTEIEFKLNESEVANTIKIIDLKEFSIENSSKYKRFTTQIDRSTSDINQLSFDRNPTFKEETLLLKVLAEGETNLYEYQDVNLIRFFISKGSHETVEQLVYKEYKIDGENQIGENNFYKQQLFNALKSDKIALNNIEKISYSKSDILQLIIKSNSNKAIKSTVLETKQSPTLFNLKIISGINAISLAFGNNNNNIVEHSFNTKAIFTIGFEAESVFSFNKNKWSVFTNPNYQSYSVTETKNESQTITADYSYIELPFGVRHYLFLNKKSQLFINAGLTLAISFDSTLQYSGQILDISNSSNLFTGVGYKNGRFDVELRYNFSRGILSRYQSWESSYSSLGILLGYKIF
jgi:hypothetical protein